MKTFLKWSGNILLGILIIALITTIFSLSFKKTNNGEPPSILGIRIMTVLTGSMAPVLNPGDIVVTKSVDADTLKQGDVITFMTSQGMIVTHRINEIIVSNGVKTFRTKGDANNTADAELAVPDRVLGTLIFGIPYGGKVADFLRTPIGLFLVFLIPITFFATTEVIRLIKKHEEENDNEQQGKDSIES